LSTFLFARRAKLTEVFISGDEVKLMKMSLIAANPEMSESLRRDAGVLRSDLKLLICFAHTMIHDEHGQMPTRQFVAWQLLSGFSLVKYKE